MYNKWHMVMFHFDTWPCGHSHHNQYHHSTIFIERSWSCEHQSFKQTAKEFVVNWIWGIWTLYIYAHDLVNVHDCASQTNGLHDWLTVIYLVNVKGYKYYIVISVFILAAFFIWKIIIILSKSDIFKIIYRKLRCKIMMLQVYLYW